MSELFPQEDSAEENPADMYVASSLYSTFTYAFLSIFTALLEHKETSPVTHDDFPTFMYDDEGVFGRGPILYQGCSFY